MAERLTAKRPAVKQKKNNWRSYYMTEKGKVREVRDNIVIVVTDSSSACFGCMSQECRSTSEFISAENPLALPLEPGQMVEIKPPDTPFLGQTLTALLPPILSFIAGFILIRVLSPGAGEGAAAGMGLILLFAASFIVYRIRRKKPAQNATFMVSRIIG